MLIKTADDRGKDLEALQALLAHPRATAQTRTRIEQEMRNMRAGAKGEAEAAYEIDFHHKASRNWAVIHDLRIEYQGRVAQIDHLLINRVLEFWVCESKHFSEGVAINEQSEFTAFYGGRGYGVASPIEQNRKHLAVLEKLMSSSIVQLPTRLGIPLKPSFRSVVLVSKNARISRPKGKVEGIDSVIKADSLRKLIERDIDKEPAALTLLSMTKLIGQDTLEGFAKQVAKLHRPIAFDWAAKFGLTPEAPTAQRAKGRATIEVPSVTAAQTPEREYATARVATGVDPHEGRVSTSKLVPRFGVKSTGEVLERLTIAGLLRREGEQHVLTDKGASAGGVFVEKGRYAPYFLWPANLSL
jgi:hypothetical protein